MSAFGRFLDARAELIAELRAAGEPEAGIMATCNLDEVQARQIRAAEPSRAADELDIEQVPELIEALRKRLLFDHDGEYLDPEGEQFYLLALTAIEQAERFAKLALYKTRQARAR